MLCDDVPKALSLTSRCLVKSNSPYHLEGDILTLVAELTTIHCELLTSRSRQDNEPNLRIENDTTPCRTRHLVVT